MTVWTKRGAGHKTKTAPTAYLSKGGADRKSAGSLTGQPGLPIFRLANAFVAHQTAKPQLASTPQSAERDVRFGSLAATGSARPLSARSGHSSWQCREPSRPFFSPPTP